MSQVCRQFPDPPTIAELLNPGIDSKPGKVHPSEKATDQRAGASNNNKDSSQLLDISEIEVAPSSEFMGLPTLIHKKVFEILHSHPSGFRKFKALRSCSKGMRAVADDVTDAVHFCTAYPPALEPYLLALHNLTKVTVRKSHGIGFSKGLEMLSRVAPEPRLLHLRLLGGACSRHETKSFCASSFSLQWCNRLRHLNLCNCRCASEGGGTPTSLTFLHHLPALEELVLNNVSPCLIGADLAWCERLTSLDCSNCYMTALDLNPCRATLRILNCSTNVLASVDVSCCTSLRQLDVRRNHLTTLDLATCVGITAIDCSSNKLRHLEASACVLLTRLVCHHNNLSCLSLAACIQLKILECGFNRISTADIAACTLLEVLKCGHNELAFLKLPVGGVLTTLDCKRNGLTLLDVSSCVGLLVLECRANEISSLNLAACSALRVLDCSDNLLCALDLSACPALNMVECSMNELFTLDLSSALALETLVCARNRLAFLTVSGCTKLARLDCIYNKLCILDVTTCIGLLYLDCSSNFLSRLHMSEVFDFGHDEPRPEVSLTRRFSAGSAAAAAVCGVLATAAAFAASSLVTNAVNATAAIMDVVAAVTTEAGGSAAEVISAAGATMVPSNNTPS